MPRILLIDDSIDSRDTLARLLVENGFDVITASDGLEGIESATSEHPDLVLMDLNMPNVSGWEATSRLRTQPETVALPIIALTGHVLPTDREKALAAGCSEYLTKPVDYSNLLSRIEQLLIASRDAIEAEVSPADTPAA